MTEPRLRFDTVRTIGRGVSFAPSLRRGLGITFLLALIGSGVLSDFSSAEPNILFNTGDIFYY